MSDTVTISTVYPDMPYINAVYEILLIQITTIHCWAVFLEQPERANEHHQLRIALKQLRYSLDAFSPILCDDVLHCLDDIKLLQDELGTLHDVDMLIASIQQRKQDLNRPIMKRKLYEGERTARSSRKRQLNELLQRTQLRRLEQFQLCAAAWKDCTARDIFGPLQTYLAQIDLLIQEHHEQQNPDGFNRNHISREYS